jgi:hypothetical protein
MQEGRYGNGATVSEGLSGEGNFTGDPDRYEYVQVLEWASVSIGDPLLGNMERRSILRVFEIKKYIKRYVNMPCQRVSVSIGAPYGGPGEDLLAGTFWIKKKKKRIVYLGSFLDSREY